jgi:hypothetical protein
MARLSINRTGHHSLPETLEQVHNQRALMVHLEATLTCPSCGHRKAETMPVDRCIYFYDCVECGRVLKPKAGDCCVFCSYGDKPCPPMQDGGGCCAG